ncbi:TIR domain-containing protein [Microbacterium sp.]|uniref:TIR domain-containing protein n=1 Tax=Microbacterium sp. TaxID=51671 RepID=UPI002811F262|nr:TIR domain-containing protein [Microbacterium sp.]
MPTVADSVRRFRLADLRYFAAALSEGTTHGGLDAFDLSLGITTSGNKTERSAAILAAIFKAPDADDQLINMLDELYLIRAGADFRIRTTEYRLLDERVLQPLKVVRTDDGYKFQTQSAAPTRPAKAPAHRSAPPTPGTTPSSSQAPSVRVGASHTVFIVHGRDKRPVDELQTYLRFLGLRMMPWSEAVELTGKPQPHTYDIVKAGIEHSAAVIVIFSPDDEARKSRAFADGPDDPDLQVRGQARQNVTLEAGLAFGIAADKTIFVKSAKTRDISDIDGFNWVTLNGDYDSRRDLKQRLATAGADLRPQSDNLMDAAAGSFKVA